MSSGVACAVDVPREMRDVVALRIGRDEHRELQHQRHGELRDLVEAQGLEIDGLAHKSFVVGEGHVEVAERLDAVASAHRREIHVRVADMRQLEVDQRGQLALVLKELCRVPRHERRSRTFGDVAPQP